MKGSAPYAITISRMLGSGGVIIGKQLAKRLNIGYFDKEIIARAAEKLGLDASDLGQYDEAVTPMWQWLVKSGILDSPSLFAEPRIDLPTDQQLHAVVSEIIKKISEEISAVIIGRNGSYILRDHPRHISVFLHCDTELRIKRIQEVLHLPEKKAQKLVASTDSKRGHYIQQFSGENWTDSRQYTICLDTGKTSLDDCVEVILKLVESQFGLSSLSLTN
ncbi:MAG TPA: cytidylate kinase-like family protein [Bacillota bacterium]|nr:cytidylate kinase-like family protein [Bacillota bacterium]